jgi:urease accessory protein
MNATLLLERVVGLASEPHIARALHRVEHEDGVEYLSLSAEDTQRHRLRAKTDRGTDCAIALPRDQHLHDGAVLLLESDRAVVVRMQSAAWLRLKPRDAAAALELGYFAGNMHWKVEFDNEMLRVAVQSGTLFYLDRLAAFFRDGRVECVDEQ